MAESSKAEATEEIVVELPLELIKASPGFAFDIGSSVTKILYRAKSDYENGEPKNKDETANGVGKIKQKLIAREKFDDVITFLKENCDISRDSAGHCKVYSTGAGGNLFKNKIEEELTVELVNLSEFDCFIAALRSLIKTQSAQQLFKPRSEAGLEQAEAFMETMKGFKASVEAGGKGKMTLREPQPYDAEKDDRYPFLLAMCGSGFGFMKVEEDGTYEFAGGAGIGGRFFLGLTSYLTGMTDFKDIAQALTENDGKTADIFTSDIIDPSVKDDMYAEFKDMRVFPLGKGLDMDKKDQTTKGDLVHSVFETICENTGAIAFLTARALKVPRVYFAGNFVNSPKAQDFITRIFMLSQRWGELDDVYVNFEFIRNGGMLGAIGAFTEAYNQEQNTKNTKL